MDDQRLRERLNRLADDVRPIGSVPEGLIPRARWRSVLVPAFAALALVAIAVVASAGVRELVRSDPGTPAVPGPVTGPVAEVEDHITVVLGRDGGALPGAAAAFDPDGEPAGPFMVALAPGSVPLDRTADGRLAFTPLEGGGVLSVFGPDGEVTQLVQDGSIYGASWSPDGTRLAYAVGSFGDTTIRVVNADGSNDTVLVASETAEWNAEPSWSPDGATIAFLRGEADFPGCDEVCRFVGDRRLELWAVNAGGTGLRPLAPSLRPRGYHAPAWSPDGSRIAVAAYTPQDDISVYVVDAASGQTSRLTRRGGGAPVWSPEGDRLAFVAQDGPRFQVYLVNADGGDERELLTPPVWSASVLIWDRAPLA
jgi:dipeptidyl aminopeptidase/acylaminoacyl peptidase